MARGLKFRIKKEEGVYFLCSENRGADQLRGYREADLLLCFRICKKPVFSRRGSFINLNSYKHTKLKPVEYSGEEIQITVNIMAQKLCIVLGFAFIFVAEIHAMARGNALDSLGEEPVCVSKFDYDFKMLKTMVDIAKENEELRETVAALSARVDQLTRASGS